MGKRNVSEAYLQISGTQGCLLSSQPLIAIWAVGWLLPSWSSCSSVFAGDELPPQIALHFEILSAHQQCISDFLNFCILFECKEKGVERALSEVGRGSQCKRAGGLLYLASPQKQLSQGLRLVNYEPTAAPCRASQTDELTAKLKDTLTPAPWCCKAKLFYSWAARDCIWPCSQTGSWALVSLEQRFDLTALHCSSCSSRYHIPEMAGVQSTVGKRQDFSCDFWRWIQALWRTRCRRLSGNNLINCR